MRETMREATDMRYRAGRGPVEPGGSRAPRRAAAPSRRSGASGGSGNAGEGEPRVIRCQATRKQPRFPGERCNGFVHRGMRDLRVHSLVQHSDDAPRDLEVVGCIRCGALHVLVPAPEPTSGTRVRAPP